jgi:transcription initiation factor TFIIE subunit alpha
MAKKQKKKIIRLSTKLINDTVTEAVGEDAIPVIEFLRNKKNISEFIIAEKTNIEIHMVRNILYRLQRFNLATYKRKKDSKKGYYISYWTFNPKRIKDLIGELQNQKLASLRERLEREERNINGFFLCPNTCVRLDFDKSIELDFKCPECGSLLVQQDNSKTIDNIKEKIKELEGAMA